MKKFYIKRTLQGGASHYFCGFIPHTDIGQWASDMFRAEKYEENEAKEIIDDIRKAKNITFELISD